MVSFSLLSRGLFYFTVMSSNALPYIKHGMDVFYSQAWKQGPNLGPCGNVKFTNVCFDDFFHFDFSMSSELGCCMVILLMTFILVIVHTLVSIYYLCFNCNQKDTDFIAGAEDGCCGAGAVLISLVTFDAPHAPPKKDDKKIHNWIRRGIRGFTVIFQIPILLSLIILFQITQRDDAWQTQRTSVVVLFPVLMLNLTSFIENIGEVVVGFYGH
ncbi:hypothetical protein EDD86DRAFT_240187 [Gorgonomyces haynaldii]|nr:hypothetical protein EDD86DRAFT_240187 [Gorgonomyces haynaldii]